MVRDFIRERINNIGGWREEGDQTESGDKDDRREGSEREKGV